MARSQTDNGFASVNNAQTFNVVPDDMVPRDGPYVTRMMNQDKPRNRREESPHVED